jgi:hypothetical protein
MKNKIMYGSGYFLWMKIGMPTVPNLIHKSEMIMTTAIMELNHMKAGRLLRALPYCK